MSNKKIIWDYFARKGMSFYAIAGLMGNLQAESNLNPKNLQGVYEKKLGMTDESYTQQVDNGTYTNFVHDSAGYGLAQWTWWSRKQGLYDMAKQNRCSIGDLQLQLDYLWYELSGHYKTILKQINNASSVREASDIILTQYERPADQNELVCEKRANYGMKFYVEFATTLPPDTLPLTGPGGLNPDIYPGGYEPGILPDTWPDTLPDTTPDILPDTYPNTLPNGSLPYPETTPNTWPATYIQSFSNSDLVELSLISPNITKNRNHIIDTITIHVLVGQATLENALEWFSRPTTEASCNYVIDKDGRVGLCCEEKDRSWCTSSRSNDHRAITIECASDKTHPYAVNDKVYEKLIVLVADICRRNNIRELKWKADKNLIGNVEEQNMTVHRWFANKSCPGEYLYSRYGEIAARVNYLLSGALPNTIPPFPGTLPPTPNTIPPKKYYYRVRKTWSDAASQIGAYESLANAQRACDKAGKEYRVYDDNGNFVYPNRNFKVGDEINLVPEATYTSGQPIPEWVFEKEKLYLRKDNGDDTYVFSTLQTGAVTGTTNGYMIIKHVPKELPYMVKITAAALNVRSGPGASYQIKTQVKKNQIYTIVEEQNGWGRLKSGAGWISLSYVKKV